MDLNIKLEKLAKLLYELLGGLKARIEIYRGTCLGKSYNREEILESFENLRSEIKEKADSIWEGQQ